MNKQDRKKLEQIEKDLKRGLEFIKQNKTLICRVTDSPANNAYTNEKFETWDYPGKHIFPINKKAGSRIQLLERALDRVRDLQEIHHL